MHTSIYGISSPYKVLAYSIGSQHRMPAPACLAALHPPLHGVPLLPPLVLLPRLLPSCSQEVEISTLCRSPASGGPVFWGQGRTAHVCKLNQLLKGMFFPMIHHTLYEINERFTELRYNLIFYVLPSKVCYYFVVPEHKP